MQTERRCVMKARKMTIPAPADPNLVSAVADAQAAAARAAKLAADAVRWAQRAEVGADDAAEALLAAHRARQAADRAAQAETTAEAASLARLAWAACTSAVEASARVTSAIVEQMVA